MEPIMELTSHIEGKNATVRLFADRVEWERKGAMSGGAKAALGVATAGLSLFATGVGSKRDTQMIPVRSIAGVSTRREGLRFTVVALATPAGELGFRVSHREAEAFAGAVRGLLLA